MDVTETSLAPINEPERRNQSKAAPAIELTYLGEALKETQGSAGGATDFPFPGRECL